MYLDIVDFDAALVESQPKQRCYDGRFSRAGPADDSYLRKTRQLPNDYRRREPYRS